MISIIFVKLLYDIYSDKTVHLCYSGFSCHMAVCIQSHIFIMVFHVLLWRIYLLKFLFICHFLMMIVWTNNKGRGWKSRMFWGKFQFWHVRWQCNKVLLHLTWIKGQFDIYTSLVHHMKFIQHRTVVIEMSMFRNQNLILFQLAAETRIHHQ